MADERHQDRPTRTLGDLLYADARKPRVSENEWVALIRSIAAGNQDAMYALYEQAHRLVFTLIVRIMKNAETAEELTVDVFHDVWRRAASYDPAGGSVVGWIMNQARSRAIDRVRFERRKKRVTSVAEALPVALAPDPETVADVKEQGRLLREALVVLTPAERQTIEAAFFSALTHREVAAQLDQPLGTIKTRIRSGLGKLREALTKVVKDR